MLLHNSLVIFSFHVSALFFKLQLFVTLFFTHNSTETRWLLRARASTATRITTACPSLPTRSAPTTTWRCGPGGGSRPTSSTTAGEAATAARSTQTWSTTATCPAPTRWPITRLFVSCDCMKDFSANN